MNQTTANPFKKPPAAAPMTVPRLFAVTLQKEYRVLGRDNTKGSSNYKKNLRELYCRRLFRTPLFWPDPIAGFPLFENTFHKSRAPFDFSVARRGDEVVSVADWKYHKLLELLHKEKDTELRWLLLARWLKQEKICEPEGFLPKPIFDRLNLLYFRSLAISVADFSYLVVITGWNPYFIRLESDLQKLRSEHGDLQAGLEQLGYDASAVKFAVKKRTTASRIMHWLAARRHVPVEKLQNAYSRAKKDTRNPLASNL
jgi:hypothetical protein